MRKTSPSERSEVLRRLYGQEGDLPAFFALYDELLHKGSDFVVNVDSNSVQPLTNEEVMVAVDLLRENSSSTNDEFSQRLQESLGSQRSESEIGRLVNLAVQAMIMVDCSAKTWHSADYSIGGYKPISWLRKETFLEFVDRSFQVDPDPVANEKVEVAFEEKAALKAWKLRKRLGVRFRGTNNLSEHLVFDQRSNSLYLFHHAGFLKAQLEKARDQGHPLDQSMADSLQRGTLPPQLLVETLHSLQSILFPSIDRKSGPILDELTESRRGCFDRECAEYEGYKIFQEPPEDFRYAYWGERIALLHEMVMSRPPKNKLERWLHRQSNEGNALFIALVALAISIAVGIISIMIGAVQTWIAWMAWKYPVAD